MQHIKLETICHLLVPGLPFVVVVVVVVVVAVVVVVLLRLKNVPQRFCGQETNVSIKTVIKRGAQSRLVGLAAAQTCKQKKRSTIAATCLNLHESLCVPAMSLFHNCVTKLWIKAPHHPA